MILIQKGKRQEQCSAEYLHTQAEERRVPLGESTEYLGH